MELTAQHLSTYKEHTVSLSSSPTPIYSETHHKGELRLTSGRYPSGTKITEEETGSNPYCSAAAAGDPQVSRVWTGPPAILEQGALTVRRETKN